MFKNAPKAVKAPKATKFAGSLNPITTSTARANLFQIVGEVSKSGKCVIVHGREGGAVHIIPASESAKVVAKVQEKPAKRATKAPIKTRKPR